MQIEYPSVAGWKIIWIFIFQRLLRNLMTEWKFRLSSRNEKNKCTFASLCLNSWNGWGHEICRLRIIERTRKKCIVVWMLKRNQNEAEISSAQLINNSVEVNCTRRIVHPKKWSCNLIKWLTQHLDMAQDVNERWSYSWPTVTYEVTIQRNLIISSAIFAERLVVEFDLKRFE